MTNNIETIKSIIIEFYGELTHENVWNYAEAHEIDITPNMLGLSDCDTE